MATTIIITTIGVASSISLIIGDKLVKIWATRFAKPNELALLSWGNNFESVKQEIFVYIKAIAIPNLVTNRRPGILL